MKQLDLEIKTNGRTYTQVKRTDTKAMYKSDDGVIEVFKIKIAPAAEIYGKQYPDRESYPGNELFGVSAYCYSSREDLAELKYNSL